MISSSSYNRELSFALFCANFLHFKMALYNVLIFLILCPRYDGKLAVIIAVCTTAHDDGPAHGLQEEDLSGRQTQTKTRAWQVQHFITLPSLR
jgi:hypothetical protein